MPTAFGNYTPNEIALVKRRAALAERKRIAEAVIYPYLLRGEALPTGFPMIFGGDLLHEVVAEAVAKMRAKGRSPKGEYARLP